jgi:hypothetical protein
MQVSRFRAGCKLKANVFTRLAVTFAAFCAIGLLANPIRIWEPALIILLGERSIVGRLQQWIALKGGIWPFLAGFLSVEIHWLEGFAFVVLALLLAGAFARSINGCLWISAACSILAAAWPGYLRPVVFGGIHRFDEISTYITIFLRMESGFFLLLILFLHALHSRRRGRVSHFDS